MTEKPAQFSGPARLPLALAGLAAIAVVVLLLFHPAFAAEPRLGVAAIDEREVAALAEQAKETFQRRMSPPAPYLALPQIVSPDVV